MPPPGLYLDEDVRPLLATVLRERGYDALHVLEVGRQGLSDPEQLRYAVETRRAILTFNLRDYLLLDQAYRVRRQTHYGIILFDQVRFDELLRRILRLLARYSGESLIGQVVWLQQFKS